MLIGKRASQIGRTLPFSDVYKGESETACLERLFIIHWDYKKNKNSGWICTFYKLVFTLWPHNCSNTLLKVCVGGYFFFIIGPLKVWSWTLCKTFLLQMTEDELVYTFSLTYTPEVVCVVDLEFALLFRIEVKSTPWYQVTRCSWKALCNLSLLRIW